MPTFYANGRILPESSAFNWQGIRKQEELPSGAKIDIKLFVARSQVVASAVCSAAADPATIRNSIVTLGDDLAAYAGFFQLRTVSCEIDSFYSDDLNTALTDSSESHVMTGGSKFSDRITFKQQPANIDIAIQMLNDKAFSRAIYELRQSARQRDYTALHCFLAIESIRNAFGSNEMRAWESMHENLNLEASTLKSFKAAADDQRHGRNRFQDWNARQRAMQIAWEVVWRYLHFMTGERKPFSIEKFPML